jgi:hypothetical protein
MHGCMAFFLTGSATTDNVPGMYHTLQNASLDQYLAALYGGTTKFRSAELTVGKFLGPCSASCIALGEGGAILSQMDNPQNIWDKYFASLIVGPDPKALADAAKERALGKSILDYVASDVQRLMGRLAGTEKQKLQMHLTAVRDLETQLATVPPPMSTCVIPPRHAMSGNANPADDYIVGSVNDAGLNYLDRITDMQIELLSQILICDLTRYATLVFTSMVGPGNAPVTMPDLSGNGTMVNAAVGTDIQVPANFHNDIAHKTTSTWGPYSDTPVVAKAVASVQRYYHGKIARMMQRLQAAGMLDNTVILIGNEGGAGWHTIRQVPIVMAGGANGALKMGRRIVHPNRKPQVADHAVALDGSPVMTSLAPATSHNSILVAVANVFRAAAGDGPITSYGTCSLHPEFTQGISGLI